MKFNKLLLGQSIFVAILFPAITWAAQSLPTGTIQQINPGRTGEELTPQDEPPSLIEPDLIKLPREEQVKIQQGQEITFKLNAVEFIDSKAFTTKELYKFYAQYLGQNISITEVKQLARNITAYLRNKGYILTRVIIPPQEVANGLLKLQIIEGYINNVSVEGNIRPATRKLLLAYAHNIAKQRPLKIDMLERYALLATDIPDATVKTVIRASESNPGSSDLVFIVTQEKNNWYAGANNFSSELLGREQMVGGVNANGYFAGSQTGVRGVLGFYVNRLKYFALLHKQQINSKGLGIDANMSATVTHPNFSSIELVNLQTPGQAFIFNANTTYPIIRARKRNLIVGAGFHYLNSHTSYYGVRLFDDAIRSIDINTSYNFFTADSSLNNIELALYQGLNILNAHASPPTVPGGKTNFSKITGSANRYQRLPAENFYLLLWVKGQFGFTQLLSSEKFGFGGSPFGYGYDPSVITGDRGYALKIEPQYNYAIRNQIIPQVQIFGFYDTASVWNLNQEIQPGHQSATSMGGGVRAVAYKRLSVELIVAQPFNVFATNNNKNRTRLMFNIFYRGGEIFG